MNHKNVDLFYLYKVVSTKDPELIQLELESLGLKDSFIIEEKDTLIGGHAKQKITHDDVILVSTRENEVNWEDQWNNFAQNFENGLAHIPVKDKILHLKPGAGFGDNSHETTSLMLEMMEPWIKDQHVVDVGSGSGILTLAAIFLGAKSVIGIEIDSKAIEHAKENASLNNLFVEFYETLPEKTPPSIFLMNMTLEEQKKIPIKKFNKSALLFIVSGILEEQKDDYLSLIKKWDWKLKELYQKGQWLGLIFEV